MFFKATIFVLKMAQLELYKYLHFRYTNLQKQKFNNIFLF